MSDAMPIPDARERQRALDPAQSFIVQAPAGSGKTGLLIQRYLRLLVCVDAPEEIIVVTFTRKAAAEMRERVLAALVAGKTPAGSGSAYEALTKELSAAVLQRDHEAGWHIAENPVRLRIQTIDSLCASLTRQMPMLSKFGAQPETLDDAADLYLEAARATIAQMESNNAIAQDVERLLEHLDNDQARIEALLAEMLARRDHWLRHMHGKTRIELETALKDTRQAAREHIFELFPADTHNELLELVRYAAANLSANGDGTSSITACDGLSTLTCEVEQWYGIAELLLKKDGDWRERLSVTQGFPAGGTKPEKEEARSWKNRLETLIEILSSNDALRQALHAIRQLPPPDYTDKQWEILGAITRLLPHAVAQLKIIFQLCGKVDFTEVAQGALHALGDSESPTDLALALDYRIRHLLIDEFQDTSISQFRLVEQLIAGWETGEGRSLFVVGDPMQSIYRFREAEVGLFLQTRRAGIGNLVLQPITLSANFRSQQGIVDWVNATFARVMPVHEDITTGAVAYTPSVATHAMVSGCCAVTVHPFLEKNHEAEARRVTEIIVQSRQDNPEHSIAILVRNRSHLREIIVQLKAAELCFRAIEIEALHHKAVVLDLLVLTRALINLADRIAWFALLRAPWCGLTLKDFNALRSVDQSEAGHSFIADDWTVWELLSNESHWSALSPDGIKRLRRIREILQLCIQNRCRQSLRMSVETAWQALGGPGCLSPASLDKSRVASDLNDAMIYLDYLENYEVAGNIPDLEIFEKGLSKLYASPDLDADEMLQIMTIHKAKGLEFDTVIVPGLGRIPRSHDKQLLKWMEFSNNASFAETGTVTTDLLLAPIQETGAGVDDVIYAWLEKLDREKENFEADRLLYVAATRARKFLHLLGNVSLTEDDDGNLRPRQPASNALLRRLWPVVQPIYIDEARKKGDRDKQSESEENKKSEISDFQPGGQSIYRLTTDWLLPPAPGSMFWQQPGITREVQDEIEFSWVSEVARHVGSVVHRWLQQIAEDEMRGWDVARIQGMHDKFRQGLLMNGMNVHGKEGLLAVERIILALSNAVRDERGQWILSKQPLAQNELHMTGVVDDKPISLVIDRTFCDADGKRWIIDYKTSSHEGSDIEEFLDREQLRYREQLNRYAVLMWKIDEHRPVRLGIYFPLLNGWREWNK